MCCFAITLFCSAESFLSQVFVPGDMFSSPIVILCKSATAGPKHGLKKEEGEKKNHTRKNLSRLF